MRTKSYSKFWQRLHKSASQNNLPLRVMFELTYKCNFNCKHCYVPEGYRETGELKTKEVFSILDQLADIGCFYLGFTGGEPFMREDINDILWYARKNGFEIIIYTNGSLLDKQMIKDLQRLRPNKVDITIPCMTKTAFERIVGVAGSRDKVFKNINLLHRHGINLGFKTCVLKENEKEISDIQKFAHSLGALHRLDTMLSRRLDGSDEPYLYRGSLKKALQDSRDNTEKIDCYVVTTKQEKKQAKGLFTCGVGVSQAAITPQGELKMCLLIGHPKYNILNSSLAGAWRKLKESVSNIGSDKNNKCDNCQLAVYCKWCPAKSWLSHRDFTSCDLEIRHWVESTIGD